VGRKSLTQSTRISADAQCDGRPAIYRWRPLLNVVDQIAKIFGPGKLPLGQGPPKVYIVFQPVGDSETSCKVWLTSVKRRRSNEGKTRNPLKFAGVGCPKVANRSRPLVRQSSPYYEDMWRRYCRLKLFPIVDPCLSCEDIARQSCVMGRMWRIFASCIFSTFQTCISKFTLRPHHVWKYGRHAICDH